ncbi:MAG: response regulator [Cyanobacteria bacterium J06641_5]
MDSESQSQPAAASQSIVLEYTQGRLTDILLSLQQKQATGIARVESLAEDRVLQRVIAIRDGSIVYASHTIPTPHEFVTELAKHTPIGVLDTVLAFAAKRSSIQSVMRAMVDISVLRWPQITAAVRAQTSATLEELLPAAGRVTFTSGLSGFDLLYGGEKSGFTVDALLLESQLRNKKSKAPTETHQNRTKPVILSVDDSSIAQALVKRTLAADYVTVSCDCAMKALNVLNSREDISMLLLDLTLPDMDGLEFCRMLRKVEKYKGLPIVMLTARDGVVDRVRSRMVGTNRYLTKPVRPAELLSVVAQYVG